MEKTAILKSWPKHNFPDDLWIEILSRFPVRSLVQFRCVSKWWRGLIDDPDFAHLQLTRFSNNRHESHLISERETEFVVMCTKTFRTTDIQSTYTLPSPDVKHWYVASTIDGLFMLRGYAMGGGGVWVLRLWNPSIRKFRRVPPIPENVISNQMYMESMCLGFDPLSRHYKYVIFVKTYTSDFQFVAVYTVGTNSWKKINLQAGEGCFELGKSFDFLDGKVCCRGVIYALNCVEEKPLELISFDLRSETLGSTNLPLQFGLQDDCTDQMLALADGGSSLALVKITENEGYVWVSESTGGGSRVNFFEWTKHYKFTSRWPEPPAFQYIKKNGEVLLSWQNMVTSYNLETHQQKIMLETSSFVGRRCIWEYKESLILL